MKTYIVTITKALGKKEKVEVLSSSKKKIIDSAKINFGLGIQKFGNNDIILKSELPIQEQSFHYNKVDFNNF